MSSRPSRGAARLAAILDALPDALLLVNCNGTVVNANTIALEAFETPGTALVGRGLLDLLPEFDPNRIPGSMRRPDEAVEARERQKPTRMTARRTDGSEFPVEVTSANLEDGRTPYASAFEAAFADHGSNSYTGNELLMLVVRDLTGTLDTESELARQQRQTEMILRAASEGVVGVDTAGRIVLVNPAAAQMLGYRAGDLGGRELHTLVHHSRHDGSPLPYEETPLSDSLRSGRKHRVRTGQVLWTRDCQAVPVDMTTAPVRDGEQLVGAVMTFTDRRAQEELHARNEQLQYVLTESLRKPLDKMRDELAALASDPAGQLWPEANQTLRALAAGYARITTLVDNVLGYQQLDSGREKLNLVASPLNEVIERAVEGAVDLIGPGRAQFAVHAPPLEADVDPERMATAVAHLIADVAGVDAAGSTPVAAAPGVDSTIVVAAGRRGEVVRIEVRGPHRGGSPVHEPLVRGIVRKHGGVLQTHDVPGAAGGSSYVLEVPVSVPGAAPPRRAEPAAGGAEPAPSRQPAADTDGAGRPAAAEAPHDNETTVMPVPDRPVRGTDGPAPAGASANTGGAWTSEGPRAQEAEPDAPAEQPAAGTEPAPEESAPPRPTGRRRGRPSPVEEPPEGEVPGPAALPAGPGTGSVTVPPQGSGRRARRALAAPGPKAAPVEPPSAEPGATNGRGVPVPPEGAPPAAPPSPSFPEAPQPGPVPESTGAAGGAEELPPQAPESGTDGAGLPGALPMPLPEQTSGAGAPPEGVPQGQPAPAGPVPPQPVNPQGPAPQAAPAQPQHPGAGGEGQQAQDVPGPRVRTLGQGVPFAGRAGEQQGHQHSGDYPALPARSPGPSTATAIPSTPSTPAGTGRRRKLATPPPQGPAPSAGAPQEAPPGPMPQPQEQPQARTFAIGAPAEGSAEGPEPLDGPDGLVEVTDGRGLQLPQAAVDDELPPEPLDNPRRLLVWPEPDESTQAALSERGYRPVVVRSREEVDAQISAYPAALFVDPLTGPITRKALQSLRTAAVAAEVPVLVTAGLGQATREAAYGADPAVLLKALAPRDGEQEAPRVLLIEERTEIAKAMTESLERRGMQVGHAPSDSDAVMTASALRPNLVVMDLLQVRRRRAGIIDWLRVNGLLHTTPFVVYTSADTDPQQLARLSAGETVLFLAERSTNDEVQTRIVDLLMKLSAS